MNERDVLLAQLDLERLLSAILKCKHVPAYVKTTALDVVGRVQDVIDREECVVYKYE